MKLISHYLPVILWAAFIFYLSSIPKLQVTSQPTENFITRKSAHIVAYAILAILIYRSLGWKKALLAIALSTLYGVSDEIHQRFVPERSFHFTDIMFDSIGAIVGIYGINYLERYSNKIRSFKLRSKT